MNAFSVFKRVLSFSKNSIRYFIYAVLSSLIGVSLQLITPLIIGKAVDNIIGEGDVDFTAIGKICILLALTVVSSAFFQWLTVNCTNALTYKTVKNLRVEAYNKINRLELKSIDREKRGDIITRITTDVDLISDGLLQGFTQLFNGVITIVGTLILMLKTNVPIGLVVILLTPLSLFASSFIAKHTHDKFTEQADIRGELSGLSEEMISNHGIVTSYNYSSQAQKRFEEIDGRLYKVGVMAQFYSALTNPVTRFVNNTVYAAVAITGALSVAGFLGKAALTVGGLSCFLTYANQYTKPFNEISGVIAELQNALAGAKRVFQLTDTEEMKPDSEDKNIPAGNYNIDFNDVSFSYTEEKPVIRNFSLNVKSGQKIAIVGHTGCGKTTLINLLMRFYDVNEGSITINGRDIRDINRKDLRELFGMVLQDTWLFSGSIRDNIAYFDPSADDEKVISAAKTAYAHSFIMRLENGYDTVITENEGNISAGQKQLLCIARVMLKDPPMLILDEATSNIDTRTEILIQKAFDNIMQGKTTFIVAHRLSTIRSADAVIVMDKGKIVETGTHNELMEKKGHYYKLYNSQFSEG